jgi:hypothetical protein
MATLMQASHSNIDASQHMQEWDNYIEKYDCYHQDNKQHLDGLTKDGLHRDKINNLTDGPKNKPSYEQGNNNLNYNSHRLLHNEVATLAGFEPACNRLEVGCLSIRASGPFLITG